MENLFKQIFDLARAKFGESRLQRGLPTESRVSGSEEVPRVRSVIPNVVASGNDAGEPFGAFALAAERRSRRLFVVASGTIW